MNKILIASLAMATAFAVTPAAFATSLGTIGVVGTINNSYIDWSNSADTFKGTGTSQNGTGDLAGINTTVTVYDFTLAELAAAATTNVELFSSADLTFTATSAPVYVSDNEYGEEIVVSGILIADGVSYNAIDVFTTSDSEGGYGHADGSPDWTSTLTATSKNVITPEPSSLVLLGSGLFGLAFFAFRKSNPAGFTANL